MAHKRTSDPAERTWFRSNRMFRDGLKWYFHTREKTTEGPFHSELHALAQLEIYIALQQSSFLANDNNYSLAPLDLQKAE